PGRIVEISGACPGSTPKFPSVPGTTTISTGSETKRRAGVTSSNSRRSGIDYRRASGRFRGHLVRLGDRFFDCADHVKGAFRQVVVITGDDTLEALDRVLEVDQGAGCAGEYFGDKERLRQETLDLA